MAESAAGAANVDLPVARGDVLGGKYRVEDVLGMGGTAVVVSATHLQLQQKFAVKLLLPAMAKQGHDHLERLLREARVVAQMKSPHVARVVDVGTLDDGLPFMVMELLEGIDLEGHLQLRGKLPVAEAVDYVMQTCEGVAEAHSLGVVHRDLKPGNVFITRDVDRRPLVKVLDFGLSKISVRAAPEKRAITQPLEIMGTPAYMSPEQLRATRDVDERSDIWSLGVILYELLTGRPPFEDESVQELCAKIIRDPPAPITIDLPDGLETVLTRCLQKDPAHRFPKVSALAIALAPFAEQKQRLERVLRVQPLTGPAVTVMRPEDVPPYRPPSAPTQAAIVTDTEIDPGFRARRRGWSLFAFGVAGAIAGAAILAGVGIVATKSPGAEAAPAARTEPTTEPAAAPPPAPPPSVATPATPGAPVATASSTTPAATAAKTTTSPKRTKATSGARATTTTPSSTATAPKAPVDPDKLLETR